MNTPKQRPWREVVPPHPAAEMFPLMSAEEIAELAADIKTNGLRTPVVPYDRKLLDGRNRLDAMELAGVPVFDIPGRWPISVKLTELNPGDDPYAAAVSLNIHRRHLTQEQKRDLIKAIAKARPELSDNAIAKLAKVGQPTVTRVRRRAEANSTVLNKPARVEASGRRARGRKSGTAAPATPLRQITYVPPRPSVPEPVPTPTVADTNRAAFRELAGPAQAHPRTLPASFSFRNVDIATLAEDIATDLTPERLAELIEALGRFAALQRAAVEHVGPDASLHLGDPCDEFRATPFDRADAVSRSAGLRQPGHL